MQRRTFIFGLGALFGQPVVSHAMEAAPSASLLAKPFDPARSISGLIVKDEDGNLIPASHFLGRLTAINLWAPWCAPCRREMPSLSRLTRRLAEVGTVGILPLAFDWRGAARVRAFLTEAGIDNLPVRLGNGENLDATLGLSRLPTTAIVSRDGNCFATVEGEASWDDDATVSWLERLAAS